MQSAGSQRVDLQRTYKQLSANRAAHALRFAAVYTDGGCDGMPDDLTYWVSSTCLQDTTVPAVAEVSQNIISFAGTGSSYYGWRRCCLLGDTAVSRSWKAVARRLLVFSGHEAAVTLSALQWVMHGGTH
jgi:hypothetical protein